MKLALGLYVVGILLFAFAMPPVGGWRKWWRERPRWHDEQKKR